MTPPASAALLEALALQRAPRSRRPGPSQRLPEGTLQLVRMAAGEEEATAVAQRATGESPQTLREAAIFYIQQVFFAPGSSSYRVLGVDPDATDERLREHYRWLARWLHPDRNPDQWEVVFAERVNNAWQDVRTSERRARYQPATEEADEWQAVVAAPPVHLYQPQGEPDAAPPARRSDLRWLPSAVVAVLGSTAIAIIVLFYSSQRPESPKISAVESEPVELPARLAAAPQAPLPAPQPSTPVATEAAPAPAPEVAATPVAVAQAVPLPPMISAAPVAPPAPAPIASPMPVAAQTPPPKPGPPKARKSQKPPVAVAAAELVAAPVPESARNAPPPAPDVAAEARVESPKPNSRDANRLLGQLSHAYEAGDVQGMRALFASDASGPRGNRDAILAEYRRVFAESSERSLAVRDVSWFVSGETFTIVATFEAVVTDARAGRVRKTRGDLRLDLRREGDRWQIFRMQHGEVPG